MHPARRHRCCWRAPPTLLARQPARLHIAGCACALPRPPRLARAVAHHSTTPLRSLPPSNTLSPSHLHYHASPILSQLLRTHPPSCPPAVCHGLAGYFEAVLYKDVLLSIHPVTHTPNMFSWFPIYFPLRHPFYVPQGARAGAWAQPCMRTGRNECLRHSAQRPPVALAVTAVHETS